MVTIRKQVNMCMTIHFNGEVNAPDLTWRESVANIQIVGTSITCMIQPLWFPDRSCQAILRCLKQNSISVRPNQKSMLCERWVYPIRTDMNPLQMTI